MQQIATNQTAVGQLWRFRIFERAQRSERNAAWNALNGADPASDMQAAFDGYTGALQTYVDAMNGGFADAFSGMDTALNAAFASFQSILSGATTVAEVPGSYWSDMDTEVEDAQAGGAAAIGEAAQWAAAQEAGAAPPSTAVRSPARAIRVRFSSPGTGGASDPSWYVQEVEWINGPRWGRAHIVVPMSAGASREAAGSVALNPNGPAAEIKRGTFVSIDGGAWLGRVVNVRHQLAMPNGDALLVTAHDLRDDMSEVRFVGRWAWDPDNEEAVYQQGWPAHFNPGGRPNCIFSANGLPLFAPYPDYGLEGDDEPPPASDKSPYQACYWTLGLMWEYARNVMGPEGGVTEQFPWVPRCPSTIVWPVGLGASLDSTAQANFNEGADQGNQQLGGARKGRDLNAEGMGLLDFLETTLFTAGGYTLGLDFQAGKGVLRIRPDRYLQEGVSLYWKRGASAHQAAAVDGGYFEESGEDLITAMACAGGLVMIERLCSEAATELVPAWTAARFNAWRRKIVDLGGDEQAFDEACRLYPEVLTTWKLAGNFNFMAGTGFESFPRLKVSRTPWPRQLTFMTDSAGANDFAGQTWPTWVEVDTDGAGAWSVAGEFDGLELFDNGIVYLPALRNRAADPKVWAFEGVAAFGNVDDDADGMADIEALQIRMNLALPADHRLTYAAKLASELLDQAAAASELETLPSVDAQRIDPAWSKQAYADLGELYQLWLRKDSYVVPKTLADAAEADETTKETAAQTAEDAAETAAAAYHADQTPENLAASTAAATAATTARTAADEAAAEADRLHPPDRPGIVTGFDDAVRNDYAQLQNFVRRKLLDLGRLVKAGELRISGHLVSSYRPGLQVKDLVPLDGGTPFPAFCVLSGFKWTSTGGPQPDTATVLLVGGAASSPLPG